MNLPKGWYTKVIISNSEHLTRWITVSDNYLNIFLNMKDQIPIMSIHVSNLSIQEAFSEIGQMHSLKILIHHKCNLSQVYIYTPNQFDIKAIQNSLEREIEQWNSFATSNVPPLPQTFRVDKTGKFIYKNADRINFTVLENSDTRQVEIHIIQDGVPEIIVPIGTDFDVHPSLRNDNTKCSWVVINSPSHTCEYHFTDPQEMRKFVSLALNCQAFSSVHQ